MRNTTNDKTLRGLLRLAPLVAWIGAAAPACADMATSPRSPSWRFDWTPVTRIVVEKARRELRLEFADDRIMTFPVSLGAEPVGPKREQGDMRTPEGEYVIDFKHAHSDYYLAVRISYPNDDDRARAASAGVNPGGQIMIHGYPNDAEPPYTPFEDSDWTEGCIAVSNTAMDQIWVAVTENTPVTILP